MPAHGAYRQFARIDAGLLCSKTGEVAQSEALERFRLAYDVTVLSLHGIVVRREQLREL